MMVCGLVVGGIATAEAKKKAKPVATTLYFHGGTPLGELEIDQQVGGVWRKMDPIEPTDPAPKSFGLVAAGAAGTGTPNPQCAGSPFFPVWVGAVDGRIVGDLKLSLDMVSAPTGQVEVRAWGYSNSLACNETYVEPDAKVLVDLPAGQGTLVAEMKGVDFIAHGALMVQVTPLLEGPTAARVLYDSTSAISQVEFSCIPASGTSCV
jgi:hypothetical protein